MSEERSARLLAQVDRRVRRIEAYGAGTFLTLTGLVLTATSALYLTAASGRIIPGATSLVIRNNADAVTNLTLTDAGVLTVLGAVAFNSGGSDVESSVRRDSASLVAGSLSSVLSMTNRDMTDGNWVCWRFLAVDSGGTARNSGLIGLNVVTHNAAATTCKWVFQASNGASPANRMVLGAAGEGADILGSSTITVSAVAKKLLGLVSTATNDDPTLEYWQGRVATTDATVTTLATITIPATTTVQIEATVIARRTGGASGTAEDGAGYRIIATFKNVAGTATQIGTTTVSHVAESQAGWDATFDVTGATARIRVTGATGNNVTWHTTYQYLPVGS